VSECVEVYFRFYSGFRQKIFSEYAKFKIFCGVTQTLDCKQSVNSENAETRASGGTLNESGTVDAEKVPIKVENTLSKKQQHLGKL
jgi:hypothetical protein